MNFPVQVLAFLIKVYKAQYVEEPEVSASPTAPPTPPASNLNSHHVIKSVVFTLLQLHKKDRYNMKTTKKKLQAGTKRLGLLRFTPTHIMYKSWALGPSDRGAACLCRLPRSRERLSCVISLLSYTWRTLPPALANTHMQMWWWNGKVSEIQHS